MAWRGTMAGMTMLLAGCDAPDIRPAEPIDEASVARGRDAAARFGCGACHALPDGLWPRGTVGPPLDHFGARGLIAGRLPNRPDVLARFVREAPALVPGTAMPAYPAMSAAEAEDIAAWLQAPRDE